MLRPSMTTTAEPQTQAPDIAAFLTDLARTPTAEKTWRAYRSDLNLFAGWLAQTTGDAFSAKTLTRIDVRDYKHVGDPGNLPRNDQVEIPTHE
jgi:hypothetical protein